MHRTRLCLRYAAALLAALCAWCSTSASAQNATTLGGSIGATSDFVFRGLSYSRGGPAAQASLDLEHASGLYAGTFVSTTNPNPGNSPPVEIDVWVGLQRTLSESLSMDVRYLHYAYPDDPRVAEYDRDEITATLGIRGTVFLTAMYSPTTEAIASTPGRGEGDAGALELSIQRPLTDRLTLSAGVGRYFLRDIYDENYDYWGITLSADFRPIELHLAALGADGTAERIFTSTAAGERFTVTVLYRFSLAR